MASSFLRLRNDKDDSSRTESFKIKAAKAQARKGQKTVQERFPTYNLQWVLLKNWLEERFEDQGLKLGDQEVCFFMTFWQSKAETLRISRTGRER